MSLCWTDEALADECSRSPEALLDAAAGDSDDSCRRPRPDAAAGDRGGRVQRRSLLAPVPRDKLVSIWQVGAATSLEEGELVSHAKACEVRL